MRHENVHRPYITASASPPASPHLTRPTRTVRRPGGHFRDALPLPIHDVGHDAVRFVPECLRIHADNGEAIDMVDGIGRAEAVGKGVKAGGGDAGVEADVVIAGHDDDGYVGDGWEDLVKA